MNFGALKLDTSLSTLFDEIVLIIFNHCSFQIETKLKKWTKLKSGQKYNRDKINKIESFNLYAREKIKQIDKMDKNGRNGQKMENN